MNNKAWIGGVCLLLASCANASGDNWPSLRDGFSVRPDPVISQDSESSLEGESDSASITKTLEDIHNSDPEMMDLIQRVEGQRSRYEGARDAIDVASQADKERAWFTAQLELSRLNGLIDDLVNMEDPPGDLGIMADHRHSMAYKSYLEREHGKLAILQATK